MTTIEQVDLKKRKIEKLKKEISVLQEKCKHKNKVVGDDALAPESHRTYYSVGYCFDCGKRWETLLL